MPVWRCDLAKSKARADRFPPCQCKEPIRLGFSPSGVKRANIIG
ncbi:hypothetical protein HM1_3113 [Heliomicrobium modesticaldum Ice1]|uniref:Uncharacterized protein n=1 Tax=Heliobacterium modesticaldum (strain ATCC 51547 / Ice1) TaxID=498761 RepID=B0TED2_HELMI|nr:hypothetical protein HM1_3113 [Heliomicrobium modesticaldum Ice1]